MKPTNIEFRLRVLIIVAIICLGFWSPWIEPLGIGKRISVTEWLALELSRLGLLTFTVATPVVIVFASLLAAAGAGLRLWGTAYLGPGTVNNQEMKADLVMAAGPYRYVRNPLYLGTWLSLAAMGFIMPPTGALFLMILLAVFQLRLVLSEEAFLTAQLGEPYQAYLRSVPRFLPRLRTNLAPSADQPQWLRSIFSELNPIGVFITLAVLSWTYNHWLMIQGILVSFGVSIVARALMPGIKPQLT